LAFKFGYPESSGALLISFDGIKQDLVDHDFFEGDRGGFGDLFGVRRSNKATVTVDCDFMTQAQLGTSLLKVLQNRAYPHKLYIHEPAAATQSISYTGITNPSTTNKMLYLGADSSPLIASMSEISTAQYGYVSGWSTDLALTDTDNSYLYLLCEFDISAFIAAYGIEYIRRLTMFMQDLRCYQDTGEDFGYLVECWNFTSSTWIEIKRQTLTVNVSNQQYAALRPCEDFTFFSDFLSSGHCRFRIRTLQARETGSIIQMDVQNIQLFVNGFACIPTKDMNFNWRDPYTGAGYFGQLHLEEL
jgi:hypothetical protein